MEGMSEFESLVRLLDDETPMVRDVVTAKLRNYGGDVSEVLVECQHPLTDHERFLLSDLLRPSREEQLLQDWHVPSGGWKAMEDDWEGLECMLRLISDYLHDGITLRPSLSDSLDLLAEESATIVDEAGIEGLRLYLFDSRKLTGNHENYSDPRNSDLAWSIGEGKSNPLGLSLIFLLVARRLNLSAEGINFPGHFLCRIENEGRCYLMDCFNQGQLHDIREILERHSESNPEITHAVTSVATTGEMLLRLLRNLELAFEKSGQNDEVLLARKLILSIGG